MNDFQQIRERFLANARQHFLASDATSRPTQRSTGREFEDSCTQESSIRREIN